MLTLKFFGLVIIFVALMNVILALVNDDNGLFTDDYYGCLTDDNLIKESMCIFDVTQPCNFCGLCSALHMNIRESEDD